MATSDDKVKEIDKKIREIDNRIQGTLADRLQSDKFRDPNEVTKVLVHHGMLLASISEKSALITEKLSLSVDKLSDSSERLEILTIILIILTVLLALFASSDLLLNHPAYYIKMISVIIAAAFVLVLVRRIPLPKGKKRG